MPLRPAIAATLCLTLLLTACAPKVIAPIAPVTEAAPPGAPVHNTGAKPVGGLADMSAQRKVAEINQDFPVEYPVIDGKVVEAKAENGKPLSYRISVASPIADVEAWHRQVFASRAFVLKAESKTGTDGVKLVYFRGRVTYSVTLTAAKDGETLVEGSIEAAGK